VNYPNGQTTGFTYFPNSGDKQLQSLQNSRLNMSNLSKFDYLYDKEQMITQWTKQNDGVASQQLYLTYDLADQLVTWKNNTVPALHGGYIRTLTYDSAGNRQTDTYDEFPGGGWDPTETRKDETFSSVNQLTTVVGADPTPPPDPGPIHFGGEGEPPPPPPADSYSYDLNGNTTARVFWRGGGNTFEWDAANRLIAINYTGTTKRTEVTYDGLNHRKKIVEKTGTTIDSTKQFVWIGNRLAEERDVTNVVTRRYYSQGEERIGGTTAGPYYYAKDHLGSIRELTDVAGSVRARYDYDPFGNTTKVSGDLTLDFGYTGHYRHTASNLYLAPYRAYDPAIGRWLSRDPIGEDGGLNLYGYVRNNPLNAVDPLGLLDVHYWAPSQGGSKGGWYGHVSITLNNGTYISYWPSQPITPPFEHTPARPPNYALDRSDEGDRDPVNFHMDGLDEAAIERWWNAGQGHGDFSTLNNCSTTVSEALRQGGLTMPRHPVYQPDQVLLDVRVILVLRGAGVSH